MQFTNDTWWLFGLIVTGALAIIGFFLRRTINQTDEHNKSINEIKRTYVTKGELKDLKADVNNSIMKIQTDIEQIKDTCLTRRDFYASINELKDENKRQNDLILELIKGGNKIGFE